MSNPPNLTYPTALVLHALAHGYAYGFDIIDATGLASGTVYPLLRRLERLGCVASRWESQAKAAREGRPARKYYRITGEGRELLARARTRFGALGRALRPGRRPAPEESPAW
jgi:DNA-binding PadR family transcriptional regulator